MSVTSANILSGVPPADLLARERSTVFQVTRFGRTDDISPRAKTMATWRARIEESQTGSWTKLLIADIELWCNRNHGCLDFYTAQLLSGHGCLGQCLKKIGKEPSSKCHHYPAENDTAAHTLFDCPAWEEERSEMISASNHTLDPNIIIPFMLSSPWKWEAMTTFARKVMTVWKGTSGKGT